jgi:hypothetical protein
VVASGPFPNDGPGATFAFAVPCGLDFGVSMHSGRALAEPAT